MTPEEAKAEIQDIFESTRELLGGSWTTYSRNWLECSDPEAEPMAQYSMMYRRVEQPSPGDPADVAEQLRKLWKAHGHDVEVLFDSAVAPSRYILSDPPWMSGSSRDLPLIQFTISDNFATFSGTSRCVPGDEGELGMWEPKRGEGQYDE
ncbi:hypothetical protein ACFVWR_12730 [Leifsonia sp. NPDC058292]|uniref:hypothetical protein n=1 Tax=Leifsonia sp. NPDC058292 TaxID=3346428 RepID=UPI0036DEC4A1